MNRVYTIWKTNIAMQNSPFTGDVPVEHNACTTGMPEPLVILRLLKTISSGDGVAPSLVKLVFLLRQLRTFELLLKQLPWARSFDC